jgi:hypothetical protein
LYYSTEFLCLCTVIYISTFRVWFCVSLFILTFLILNIYFLVLLIFQISLAPFLVILTTSYILLRQYTYVYIHTYIHTYTHTDKNDIYIYNVFTVLNRGDIPFKIYSYMEFINLCFWWLLFWIETTSQSTG